MCAALISHICGMNLRDAVNGAAQPRLLHGFFVCEL